MRRRATGVDDGILAAWADLADRVGAPPFCRPGWFTAWTAAFAPGQVRLHTVELDGRLAAVAPMLDRPWGLRAPVNWHSFHYQPLAQDDAAAADLAASLLATRRPLISVRLADPDVAEVAALERQAIATGWRVDRRVLQRGPWIDTSGSLEAYETDLGTSRLRGLGKRSRRVPDLSLQICDGSAGRAEVAAAVEAFLFVEHSGWKGRAGTSVRSDPAAATFYAAIAAWAASEGMLRVALLRSGHRVIAADLALECAGVHYVLKTGFDPEFARASPGALLRHRMIRRAFLDPTIARYDFLGDVAEWKTQWTRSVTERSAITLTPPGLLGGAAAILDGPARRAARAAKTRWRSVRGSDG